MNINAKSLAVVIIVAGVAVVAAYNLGMNQAKNQQTASVPASTPHTQQQGQQTQAAPASKALFPEGGGAMPSNHPTVPDQARYP